LTGRNLGEVYPPVAGLLAECRGTAYRARFPSPTRMPSVALAKEGREGWGEGGDWLNFRGYSEIVPVPLYLCVSVSFLPLYCSTALLSRV